MATAATKKKRPARYGATARYEFRARAGISDATAQVIGEEILRLGGGSRPVSRGELLDSARPRSSPLHGLFEWDDRKAAEKFRLDQAGWYLRTVDIIPIVDGEEAPQTRAFHPVVLDGERGYLFSEAAWSDAGMADAIVERAAAALRAWTRTYGEYRKLRAASEVVAKLIEEIERGSAAQRPETRKGMARNGKARQTPTVTVKRLRGTKPASA